MAEQDSLAAFEFALRRYAAGKPFQAARYGFLAALDHLGHAILPGISDICLKRPHTAASRMSAAPFSPLISAAAMVFDEGLAGMIEAATTRSRSIPRTRNQSERRSTTSNYSTQCGTRMP